MPRLEITQTAAHEQPKVVIPLHGIRTRAKWQRSFARIANEKGWICILQDWDFGYFSILKFLSPFARESKIQWFVKRYNEELRFQRLDPDDGAHQYPSIVAHSFGTYILGNALIRHDHIRFNRIILVGSILPKAFPWDKLIESGQVQAIRNEYGVRDQWTRRCAWLIPGTGSSGTCGFNNAPGDRFEQACFDFSHSEYFQDIHMGPHWIRFLNKPLLLNVPKERSSYVATPRGDHPRAAFTISSLITLIEAALLLFALYLVCGILFPKSLANDMAADKILPVSYVRLDESMLRKFLDAKTRNVEVVAQNMKTHLDSGILEIFREVLKEGNVTIVLSTPEFFAAVSDGGGLTREVYLAHYGGSIRRLKRFRDSLAPDRAQRLIIRFHTGASSLSVLFRDPGDPTRAAAIVTFKYTTDLEPGNRMFGVIERWRDSATFDKVYGHVQFLKSREQPDLDNMYEHIKDEYEKLNPKIAWDNLVQ